MSTWYDTGSKQGSQRDADLWRSVTCCYLPSSPTNRIIGGLRATRHAALNEWQQSVTLGSRLNPCFWKCGRRGGRRFLLAASLGEHNLRAVIWLHLVNFWEGGSREIMSNGDTLCCSNKVKLVIIITAHKHLPTHISCLNYTVRINAVCNGHLFGNYTMALGIIVL